MSKEKGGPAFAASGHPGQQFVQQEGITLRDYFAAKAMNALIDSTVSSPDRGGLDKFRIVAKTAYRAADAMLKVRGE